MRDDPSAEDMVVLKQEQPLAAQHVPPACHQQSQVASLPSQRSCGWHRPPDIRESGTLHLCTELHPRRAQLMDLVGAAARKLSGSQVGTSSCVLKTSSSVSTEESCSPSLPCLTTCSLCHSRTLWRCWTGVLLLFSAEIYMPRGS
jgi:hypothetical protein